jgi:hypothetical protein
VSEYQGPDAGSGGSAGSGGGSAAWQLVYEDPKAAPDDALNAMWASGPDDIWVAGTNRQLVHWDGKQWDGLVKTPGAFLTGIWGRGPSEVVAAGAYTFDLSPAVFVFDGSLWTSGAPFPTGVTALTDVWGVGTQRYFTGFEGKIFQDDPVNKPNDRYHTAVITGGCPDVNDPPPNLFALDGTGLDNILAVGGSALLAHRDNTGWSRFCGPDTLVGYSAVYAVPGTKTFYVGSNYLGLLLWTSRTDPLFQIHEDRSLPNADQIDVQSIDGSVLGVVAVADTGKILYFDGTGGGVKALASPTNDDLFGVKLFDDGTIYVCGRGSRIWRAKLGEL